MGLLKKFKDIFVEEYEDDEEEVKIKPVEKKVNVETPMPFLREDFNKNKVEMEKPIINKEEIKPVIKKEEPVASVIKEEEKVKIEMPPKKEDKFVFPVYFDDNDFAKPEKKEEPKKVEMPARRENSFEKKEVKKESSYKEAYNNKRMQQEEKKIFKPTPIISPVYGVLDKNYYKEDIVVTTPKEHIRYNNSNRPLTIDDVRNKAFGKLEDDLADNLASDNMINANDFETAVEEDKKRDIGKDGLKADIESLLNNDEFASALHFRKTKLEDIKEEKKEEPENDDTLINDIVKLATEDDNDDSLESNEMIDAPTLKSDEVDNAFSDDGGLDDNDLFSLIDSMYDKEDK